MSSIGAIGGNSSMMMQGMRGMKRPDPAEMAESLFAKLDTSGQGYIQKSDLQAAFDKVSSTSSSSNVDELFSQLDSDSDGKVTQQEFSATLKQVAEQLDNQFMSMRMNGGMPGGGGMGGMGGMPPPPPGGADDAGFTKDELSSQLEEIGSSDNKRSSLIASIIENFDAADTDGDGKVSFIEAMAFDQANAATASSGTSATGASGDGSTAAATSAADDLNAKVMLQIMRLMHAYNIGDDSGSAASSRLSVSA
jgi:hypothetical protein